MSNLIQRKRITASIRKKSILLDLFSFYFFVKFVTEVDIKKANVDVKIETTLIISIRYLRPSALDNMSAVKQLVKV